MGMMDRFPIYPVLAASDIDRARTWYQEKLGMTPKIDEGFGMWFECGEGTWLLVYPTGAAGTAQNTQAHFQVTDIEGLMEELRGRGVTFEEYDVEGFREMHKGGGLYEYEGYKTVFIKDSEGNTIEIAQRPEA
jgi:catechol 2,3-dioxygenase-like lactoylglutathione lyase family enzyme